MQQVQKKHNSEDSRSYRLVDWSLTALSTQCTSYRTFKVRL